MNNACLGLAWLGVCAYDPASPAPTYFTLGNAITALAFTLAVQTFLKPIYRLRLRVRYLSLAHLYILIFAGVGMTFIAALVPNFPVLHGGWWGYAIVYELLATVLFAFAYGAVAIAVLRPISVSEKRVEQFTKATAKLLSEATESDHVDLLPDLHRSLPRLIKLAAFIEGYDDASAFYLFTHRHRIWQASYAHSMLRILSDPLFCKSLVLRAPWTVALIVGEIADKKLYAHAAQRFVQELAYQAILADDGIMAREADYQGFGEAPVFSDALFSDPFIVRTYNPLQTYFRSESITPSILRRFNQAALRCNECLIGQRHFQVSQVTSSIKQFYESAGMRAWSLREHGAADIDYVIEFSRSIANAIKLSNKLMASVSEDTYKAMFATKANEYRYDPFEHLIEIVYDALCYISNGFEGSSDRFWSLAIEAMRDSFKLFGIEPDGMTPFQQRLALKLVGKLGDNMNGYYPAICRVLLATVGPYEREALQPNMTAFNILRNAMYRELKRLPD